MKLFGRRRSDNVTEAGGTVLFGQPAQPVAQARAGDMLEAAPAYAEPVGLDQDDPFGYDRMTRAQLIEENQVLRQELSALKSRISYIKTVLLSDEVLARGPAGREAQEEAGRGQ